MGRKCGQKWGDLIAQAIALVIVIWGVRTGWVHENFRPFSLVLSGHLSLSSLSPAHHSWVTEHPSPPWQLRIPRSTGCRTIVPVNHHTPILPPLPRPCPTSLCEASAEVLRTNEDCWSWSYYTTTLESHCKKFLGSLSSTERTPKGKRFLSVESQHCKCESQFPKLNTTELYILNRWLLSRSVVKLCCIQGSLQWRKGIGSKIPLTTSQKPEGRAVIFHND